MKNYVIIGGGVASVACIEGIRSLDKTGKITLICGENRPTYCRPLISYYLQGKTDFNKMKYRSDSFYNDNNCKLVYGNAENIDTTTKNVKVGNVLYKYDSCCIATGSSSFIPCFQGLETVKSKYTFMTEDDALALKQVVSPTSNVLIMGAGLIGLKCAEGLAKRAKKIIVCDLATHILSSILDDECAAIMQKVLEDNGIEFMLGDTAVRFDENVAIMKSGKNVVFDVLVLAVGVRPNVSLIKNIGGKIDKGIIVDTSMRTTIPSIFAAGDCAQGYDSSIDDSRILAIWPNAYMQGYCAGVNMANGTMTFENAIPMNSIGFFGTHAFTAGCYEGELVEEKSDKCIKRLFIHNGFCVGFILIGNVDKSGIYTNLIREKVSLEKADLKILKKQPTLFLLGTEIRRNKLGGVV